MYELQTQNIITDYTTVNKIVIILSIICYIENKARPRIMKM